MKYFLTVTSLLLSNFIFSQISEKEIIGDWLSKSETYSNCKKSDRNTTNTSKNNDGCITTAYGTGCSTTSFKAENIYHSKIVLNGQEMIQKGTYKISGNELTITIEGYPKKYTASFENNELILSTTLLGCNYKTISVKK